MEYQSVDDWLDEIENFSTRRERLPDGALEWVKVAWELGARSPKKLVDLRGNRYGRLVVVAWAGSVYWRCKCDCGGEKVVDRRNLTRLMVTSCGCKRRGPRRGYGGKESRNAEIISRCRGGEHPAGLARIFGISRQRVDQICKREME